MKEIKRTLPNGRNVKIAFGYADSNGEFYSCFKEASYMNFNKGASYGAFITIDDPDWYDCWELDKSHDFMDRALTRLEKTEFEKKYLASLSK